MNMQRIRRIYVQPSLRRRGTSQTSQRLQSYKTCCGPASCNTQPAKARPSHRQPKGATGCNQPTASSHRRRQSLHWQANSAAGGNQPRVCTDNPTPSRHVKVRNHTTCLHWQAKGAAGGNQPRACTDNPTPSRHVKVCNHTTCLRWRANRSALIPKSSGWC